MRSRLLRALAAVALATPLFTVAGLTDAVAVPGVIQVNSIEHDASGSSTFDRGTTADATIRGRFLVDENLAADVVGPPAPPAGGMPPEAEVLDPDRVDDTGNPLPATGVGITIDDIWSPNALDAVVDVSATAVRGDLDLKVTQEDSNGQTHESVCVGCITIPDPPSITSHTPITIDNSGTDASVEINGENLGGADYDAAVRLTRDGEDDVPTALTSDTATQLVATVAGTDKADALPGLWQLEVTSDENVLTEEVHVIETPSVDPLPAVGRNATDEQQPVEIAMTGSGFHSSVQVTSESAGVTVLSAAQVNDGRVDLILDVGSEAPDPAVVRVVNGSDEDVHPDNQTTADLPVNAAPSAMTPTPLDLPRIAQGAVDQTITITGSDFVDGIVVTAADSAPITVTDTHFVDSTTVEVTVSVDERGPNEEPGADAIDLVLTNPDDGRGLCQACIGVGPGPRVDSVTDAQGNSSPVVPGGEGHELVVGGDHFVPVTDPAGVTVPRVILVDADGNRVAGADVSVAAVVWRGYDRIDVTLDVDPAYDAPGDDNLDLIVENPDEGRATLADALTIGSA